VAHEDPFRMEQERGEVIAVAIAVR
jgi:hypothetical protein